MKASGHSWICCPRCDKEPLPRDEQGRVLPEHCNWRQSYEISGVNKGVVTFIYSGKCSVCNLSLEFKVERAIPGL